jgi:hypothetical protein
MKIEVRKLESDHSDNPFRVTVWAVLRNGKVCAFCFTPEVAEALERALPYQR